MDTPHPVCSWADLCWSLSGRGFRGSALASVLQTSSRLSSPWLLLTSQSHHLLVFFFKHTLKLSKWTVNSLWKTYLHVFQLLSSVLTNTNRRTLTNPRQKTAGVWLCSLDQPPRGHLGYHPFSHDFAVARQCPSSLPGLLEMACVCARARVCVNAVKKSFNKNFMLFNIF